MLHILALLSFALSLMGGSKLCPHRCLCYDASDLVDCRSRSFSHVPHGVPHGTWLLDLGGNRLTEMRSASFTGIWAMRILLLPENGIQVLQSQALSSLTFLEKLDLSRNELRSLPPDFSQGLASLKDLRLAHNTLGRLEPPCLEQLENLEKLDLSDNRIQVVETRVFRGLSRLRYLDLSGNELAVLQAGLLGMQQALGVLLLGRNNISVVETEALASLHSLTVLGLEANQLGQLKFQTLLRLRTPGTHLRLAGNPWMCDCELHRVFGKILRVRHLHVDDYANITCHGPPPLAGASLPLIEVQLCAAETATVLVIAITVMVTVMAAVVMAERTRREKRDQRKSWNEGKAEETEERER